MKNTLLTDFFSKSLFSDKYMGFVSPLLFQEFSGENFDISHTP